MAREDRPQLDQPSGGAGPAQRHPRFPVTLPIVCRPAGGQGRGRPKPWFSRTVNLSAGGTALLLPQRLDRETGVELMLELEGRTLQIMATVRWVGVSIPPRHEYPHGLAFHPLQPGERAHLDAFLLRLGKQVQRSYSRVPLELPVTVEGTGTSPLSGRTADVGEGGAQLVLPAALATGSALTLRFTASRGPVLVEATVRWVGGAQEEQGGSVFPHGCQFHSETAGKQLAADLYIEEFLRRARGETPA